MACLQKPLAKLILELLRFGCLRSSGRRLALQSAVRTLKHRYRHAAAAHSTNDPRLVAGGKYIVEDVAICTQCHTPHTSSGDLDRSRWLEGSALWLQPASPDPNWPLRAPRLAGSPPGSDARGKR